MRGLVLAAVMFGAASGAQAADMPDFLRGSIPPTLSTATRNWDGWYAGGQVGYTTSDMDFSRTVVGLTNFIFRNAVLQQPVSQFGLLPKNHAQTTGFGAFVGRNYQFEDLVFGVEANYNYVSNLASSAKSSNSLSFGSLPGITPPVNHTYTYTVSLSGDAALQVKDVITFRGRAGWAAGNFLPYVFGGLAVGRMDVARSVTVDETLRDDSVAIITLPSGGTVSVPQAPQFSRIPGFPQFAKERRINDFVAGWTGGLGMEYMLWGNIFMRGEWEYIKFLSVKDTVVNMNSVRAGIGYKF
jgi:opacity protein-like surface antigen